jgi:apoptosis-inducing factor 3
VTSVNTSSKLVTIDSAEDAVIPYTTLILAPGSIPRRLPIPGADLSNVFTLRVLEDAQKIDQAVQSSKVAGVVGMGKRVVIIGTSFISMEVAGTIVKKNVKSVDMVGIERVPFDSILGEEVGRGLQTVRFIFGLASGFLIYRSGIGYGQGYHVPHEHGNTVHHSFILRPVRGIRSGPH